MSVGGGAAGGGGGRADTELKTKTPHVNVGNKESFTKECVRFLKKTKVLHCGKTVFTFSVGDLDDPATLSEPLTRMKVLVKALEKLLPAVRSPSSWLARFLAYQLPSPCSPGARRSFSHLEPRELQERERAPSERPFVTGLEQSGFGCGTMLA